MRDQRGRLGVIFSIIAAIVVLAAAAGGFLVYARTQLEPPSSTQGTPVAIQVEQGETLDTLTADLEAKQLIRSRFFFGWYARWKGLGGKLHAGRYMLDSGMSASYMVTKLEGPPDIQTHKLVITEGMTANQMADKVAGAGLGITREQYLAEVNSGAFTETFLSGRPAGASLEGFLFPDTYEVPDHASAHDVVQMQLDDFTAKALPLLPKDPAALYNDLVIASMVEREAQFPDDLPQVSSVIANRLAAQMPLQIDATVTYGLHETGEPSAADLAVDTPYNTYLHTGLPPTPISNPGASTITAAVHPASTRFLYYVSDGCGHNHYSIDEATHEKQVAQYVGKPCTATPTP